MPGKVVLIGPGVAGNDAGGMPSGVWEMPSLAEARVGDGDAVNARQPTIRTISATMPRRNWGKVIGERSERWGRSLVVIARSSYGERAPRGPDAESAPLRLRTVRRIGTQHAEHGRVRPHLPEGLVHLIAIRRGLEVHVEHVLERRSATRARFQLREVDAAVGEGLERSDERARTVGDGEHHGGLVGLPETGILGSDHGELRE